MATAGGKDPGQPGRAADCSLASPGQQCAPSVLSQLQFISLLHLHLNRCDSKGEVYFNKLAKILEDDRSPVKAVQESLTGYTKQCLSL